MKKIMLIFFVVIMSCNYDISTTVPISRFTPCILKERISNLTKYNEIIIECIKDTTSYRFFVNDGDWQKTWNYEKNDTIK